jgi:TetR/AcrR family transcriptional regulator, transcriptional repressor for nem operon
MRTKNFDPDGAKKRALETFWQSGYEATNMPELLSMMSLGRASFYNAFGSKHELFVQTLDLYFETLREHFEPLISRETDARQSLAVLVDGILAVARSADGRATNWRGCFIGNTALELGGSDPEVVARLKVGVDTLRSLFEKALSLPRVGSPQLSGAAIAQRALQCAANIQGLLVLAKSGLSDAEIGQMRDALIAAAFMPPELSTHMVKGTGK